MKVTLLLPDDTDAISITATGFALFRVAGFAARDNTVVDMTKDESYQIRQEKKEVEKE